MVYTAFKLLPALNHLILDGMVDGELQWIGTDEQRNKVEYETDKAYGDLLGRDQSDEDNYPRDSFWN